MFAGKKSAQIREILISESAWEEMTCLFAPSLVENRFKDWMKAIQSYLNDADYRSRQGDELRNAVQRNWYLRENGLNDWQQGWLAQ